MDILALISLITGIASLLSIFFDIERKIPISAKSFILILSVISLIFYGCQRAATQPDNDLPIENNAAFGQDYNEDLTDTSASSSLSSTSSNDPESLGQAPTADSTKNLESSSENLLQVEPIPSIPYSVPSIRNTEHTVSPATITSFSGKFVTKNQCAEYEIIPQFDGKYRFEFSNVPDGVDLLLSIKNGSGEILKSDYDLDNGDGITLTLSANNRYYAKVEPYNNVGSYTLNIGNKKPCVDSSKYTKVFDSIQYTGQQNDYSFVPAVSGKYRFEFSDVPDGTDLKMYIYNSGWEYLQSDYDLDNGDGITISLDAQHTYYIRVEQFDSIGSYGLNIGHKKTVTDISPYTAVTDSIQYTGQQNDYSFVPAVSGKYRFEFSDVPDGTDLKMYIYNSGWEYLQSDYDLDNGDGITISLDAQHTYYIRVEQFENIGSYTMNIGHKKGVTDISLYTIVTDSIQYTDQQNDYSFVSSVSGEYRFELSAVPEGTDLMMYIYNSGWEYLQSDYDLDNGDGITISLEANKTYFIRIWQYNQYGSYTVNVLNTE